MSLDYQEEGFPRLAVAKDTAEEPPSEAMVIQWIDIKTWEFLKYARSYVISNPQDIGSRLIYRNLLKAYARGNQ